MTEVAGGLRASSASPRTEFPTRGLVRDVAPVRVIAFYLPQFHPIPENDAWWGKGFTEWRNVVRARPLFRGHYQPHLPADLGFYDLRLPETREAQADLARAHGISGFCYYHYWFSGRRVLHRPFDEVRASGSPEFPFCLCWANENWTRRWDGQEQEILLSQAHSIEDDQNHIEGLLPAFEDARYIRIKGRPLFLVYRTDLLPDPARTAQVWRDRVRAAGVGDLYLARVDAHGDPVDPREIGFDAAVEFAPHWQAFPPRKVRGEKWGLKARILNQLRKAGIGSPAFFLHDVYSYPEMSRRMRHRPSVPYTRFRGATPGWDNSPRREQGARIFVGSTPDLYETWLQTLVHNTVARLQGDERIVFVNAWNEWAEGNHLEPDQRWGRAYLEATARAVTSGS